MTLMCTHTYTHTPLIKVGVLEKYRGTFNTAQNEKEASPESQILKDGLVIIKEEMKETYKEPLDRRQGQSALELQESFQNQSGDFLPLHG